MIFQHNFTSHRAVARQTLRAAFISALLVTATALPTFGARVERKIDSWKPTHYNVQITLNDQLNEITRARAEISVTVVKDNLTMVDLDFGNMTVDSVSVDRRSAPFTHTGGKLEVRLAQPAGKNSRLSIEVVYHGKPKDGLVMAKDKDGQPSVVGDNWPNRVHHWIPSLDHPSAKATVNFSIEAPASSTVVANGRRERVETTSPATRTWTFIESAPIPPYCMIFAAGQFANVTLNTTITALSFYVPRSDSALAAKGFAPAAPSLKLFVETIAPYPYEKLALIVGNTQFGGMENSGAIVFGSSVLNPDPNAPSSPSFGIRTRLVELVAHEIAHQWFGDSVTGSTWADLWLSEGFATYFAGFFVQKTDGEPAFRAYMNNAAQTYFNYARQTRTPLHDTETANLFRLLNGNNYQKGAWVLHMLRSQVGDEAFFRGIRSYYEAHKNSTASSEDLRAALEASSGHDLRQFFTAWVYGPGHPHYEMSWTWDDKKRVVRARLQQLQPEPFFPNWIPVNIETKSGKQHVVIKPTAKDHTQEFSVSSSPTSIEFDPDNTVLKELKLAKARTATGTF